MFRQITTKEPIGWNIPGFDDSMWLFVTEGAAKERLELQTIPPIKRREHFLGKLIITPSGQQVYDMGQVIAGIERMTVRGKGGTQIKLEHAEVLDKEVNFIRNITGRNKNQTDFYICSGKGDEIYEPIGTWHGFRYVMAEYNKDEAEILSMEAYAIRSDLRETSHFTCSDARLNKLWQNTFMLLAV